MPDPIPYRREDKAAQPPSLYPPYVSTTDARRSSGSY